LGDVRARGSCSASYVGAAQARSWSRERLVTAHPAEENRSQRTLQITETANNWARQFASSAQDCNDYGPTGCKQVNCERGGGTPIPGCRPSKKTRQWAAAHRGATVQKIAISGDRAAATLTSPEGFEVQTVQLRRTATGEWLIDELGPIGGVTSPGLMPCTHRRASCG
jgi:hypothetical protein